MRVAIRHRRMLDEAGSALLASVLLIVLISGVGLAAFTTSSTIQNISLNFLNAKQAFYLAESGMAHARRHLYDQITANPNLWATYATPQPQTLIPTTALATMGTYTVTIRNASGPGLLLTATGTAPNNAQMTMSSLVIPGYSNNSMFIIADKSLLISGNPTIDGTSGGVHANGDLTITGSPTISTNAEATGTYTEPGPGHPAVAGFKGGGQPRISLNSVNLSDYTNAMDYLLTTDTTYVRDPFTGNRVALYFPFVQDSRGQGQPLSLNRWNCWVWTPPLGPNLATWTLTAPCNTKINGTFYVNGNAIVQASMGTSADPWIATIIANGSIKFLSDQLYMRAPVQATDGALFKPATENVILIAYTDVLFLGNANQSYKGITRAREQVGITGDLVYNGYIQAQDGAAANYGQLLSSSYISGNAHLTYNGNMQSGAQGTIVVESTLY